MMDPLPDLEKTLSLVIQHEDQKMVKNTPQAEAVVFNVAAQNPQNSSILGNYSGPNEVVGAVSGG